MGHGSNGGRNCRRFWKWRIRTRTNSLLQSQKLVSNSRSSSGVSRSDENVVSGENVATTLGVTRVRLLRTAFISVRSFLEKGVGRRCPRPGTVWGRLSLPEDNKTTRSPTGPQNGIKGPFRRAAPTG